MSDRVNRAAVQKLFKRLKAMGISQAQVAVLLGISRSLLSDKLKTRPLTEGFLDNCFAQLRPVVEKEIIAASEVKSPG